SAAALLLRVGALQVDVEGGIRRRVRSRIWRPLVLVVEEVVDAIPLNRPAPGRRQLLIGVREHFLLNEIGGIESVVAEVAREGSPRCVGARLGDGVDLDAGRASLARVEPVRDHLELRNGVLAEARLAEAGRNQLRNLLTIDVQLETGGR